MKLTSPAAANAARHGALIDGSEPLRPGRYVWILNEGPVLGEAHITVNLHSCFFGVSQPWPSYCERCAGSSSFLWHNYEWMSWNLRTVPQMVRQQYSAGDGVISTLNRSGQKVWQLLSQISQRSVFSVKPDLVETEGNRYESSTGGTTRETQPFNSLNRSRRHLTSLVCLSPPWLPWFLTPLSLLVGVEVREPFPPIPCIRHGACTWSITSPAHNINRLLGLELVPMLCNAGTCQLVESSQRKGV